MITTSVPIPPNLPIHPPLSPTSPCFPPISPIPPSFFAAFPCFTSDLASLISLAWNPSTPGTHWLRLCTQGLTPSVSIIPHCALACQQLVFRNGTHAPKCHLPQFTWAWNPPPQKKKVPRLFSHFALETFAHTQNTRFAHAFI